jgi:hypothetical protein
VSNQIVVLASSTYSDTTFSVSGVFWLVVPTNNVVPASNFVSRVSFIDQTTLSALRAGTLVEQPFTSPNFAASTSLATVQADLVTLFTAAQTVVTNGAAPLASLIGYEYTGSAWQAATTPVFDPLGRLISDIYWAAGSGLIPGVTSGRATGYVTTTTAFNKAVMATTYTPQVTNAQRSLVSTSTADASGLTGATQVTITYLDASFAVHTEVVTLNGTTAVNTVGTNYAYIESMVVTQAGSSGTNQGTISIMTGTAGGGSAWGSIAVNAGATLAGTVSVTNGQTSITFSQVQTLAAGTSLFFGNQAGVPYYLASAVSGSTSGTLTTTFGGTTNAATTTQTGSGDNQTFWCHHYVPSGVTCYILSMECASYADLGTMYLTASGNPSSSNLATIQIGPTVLHPGGDYREHDFTAALAVTGPNLICLWTRPSVATTDTSLGNFEYLQF